MYHNLTAVGRVGKDAELRYTPSGQAVCSFSVATSKKFTNKEGNKIEETIWIRVQTWGKLAETCNQYVKKGMLVLVDGELQADENGSPRVWGDPPKSSFEMTAQTVRFLSKVEQHAETEEAF